MSKQFPTTLAPWLSIQNATEAVHFYINSFNAIETYRMDTGDGLVVKLEIEQASIWISGPHAGEINAEHMAGNIRMVLVVSDPDTVFNNAVAAGAIAVVPVGEEYGWRLGRVVDPFGLHWEMGHPL